jgi:hypothetical protein
MAILHSLLWLFGLAIFLGALWCMPPIRGIVTDATKALILLFRTNKAAQAVLIAVISVTLSLTTIHFILKHFNH